MYAEREKEGKKYMGDYASPIDSEFLISSLVLDQTAEWKERRIFASTVLLRPDCNTNTESKQQHKEFAVKKRKKIARRANTGLGCTCGTLRFCSEIGPVTVLGRQRLGLWVHLLVHICSYRLAVGPEGGVCESGVGFRTNLYFLRFNYRRLNIVKVGKLRGQTQCFKK